MMLRSRRAQAPLALAILAPLTTGIVACSDAIDPVHDDPLRDVQEMQIYQVMAERMAVLNHTREANDNLRQTVGWLPEPLNPQLYGHTFSYESATGWAWSQDPEVADNAVRVTWYQLSGGTVALPPSVQGHIDLTDLGHPDMAELRVRVSAGSMALADYDLRSGVAETATTSTRTLEVNGFVGDGERQVQLDVRETEEVSLATGDRAVRYSLSMQENGTPWEAVMSSDSSAATGAVAETFTGLIRLDGVTTRLELALQQEPSGPMTGSGQIMHDGSKIADVAVAEVLETTTLEFVRPDGSAFTRAQETRLQILVSALLILPLYHLPPYFT